MAEVAITFGASMITAILQPKAERAGNELLDYAGKIVNIQKEIINLQNTLRSIQSFIQDAEEKQIVNIDIRVWLRQLVDIGYEARDVLDDFFTYRSLKRAKKASISVNSKFLNFRFTRFRLARDITSVREKLDELKRQSDLFLNLKSVVGSIGSETIPIRQRPDTGPFQDKQRNAFVGRDDVKENIMQKVLNDTANRVDIIPIFGMRGIGKTTLAQSIFNDPRVTEGDMYPSKNRVWHCIGEKKLNAKEIITNFVSGLNSTSSGAEIHEKLVEEFKGDRFLIVLDDVWDVDRNEWKLLFEPLTNVGKGGVVILTTRIRKVVDSTNTQIPDCLQPLSDEECWSIFESHAFTDGNSNSRQDLIYIGKQIVAKLKGLPLAAKVVGCSLLNEPDAETWKSFLVTKEWLLKDDDDDIMPPLKWSYGCLPSHLKQCFMYCSLFPKDHEFDEKILIKIWMAHDIIPNVGRGGESRRPEDVGAQYFKELVNASFFQCINGKYVMHDMIHDLALIISNEDFFTLCEHSLPPRMDNVRHVSIIPNEDYAKNLLLCKSRRILTVYTEWDLFYLSRDFPHFGKDVLHDALKQWKSIRVLVLFDLGITEIPDCINELKYLRYLDVFSTEVRSLPDSLFELYNLQTLSLPYDVDLAMNVGNLKNLRHLTGANLPTCKLIAQLTSLQDISGVTVCKGDCISELRHLRGLYGTLEICGLDNVTSSEDAAQAMMQDKVFIDHLILLFTEDKEDTVSMEECGISRDVLEALNCPPNLKYLAIYYYNGDRFPSWLKNAANSMRFLSTLYIKGCKVVELLQLDAFVSLNGLDVRSCSNLRRIRLSKEVASTIEWLSIEGCRELREMEIESLPILRGLTISDCDKLISFPPRLVKIESMTVVKCAELSSLMFTLEGIKSLKYLEVNNCPMLKQFSIVEEGSSSSSSSSSASSSITAVLSLPDDEYIALS